MRDGEITGEQVQEQARVYAESVKRIITLDSSHDLSQLCAIVSLVKLMPGSISLLSAITTIEDGFIRLWRDWLNEQVQRRQNAILMYGEDEDPVDHMFWVDRGRNVGLKIRVREKRDYGDSLLLLVYRDEDTTSYELEITGE